MPFKSVVGIASLAALHVACIQLDPACNHHQAQVVVRRAEVSHSNYLVDPELGQGFRKSATIYLMYVISLFFIGNSFFYINNRNYIIKCYFKTLKGSTCGHVYLNKKLISFGLGGICRIRGIEELLNTNKDLLHCDSWSPTLPTRPNTELR